MVTLTINYLTILLKFHIHYSELECVELKQDFRNHNDTNFKIIYASEVMARDGIFRARILKLYLPTE